MMATQVHSVYMSGIQLQCRGIESSKLKECAPCMRSETACHRAMKTHIETTESNSNKGSGDHFLRSGNQDSQGVDPMTEQGRFWQTTQWHMEWENLQGASGLDLHPSRSEASQMRWQQMKRLQAMWQ
jgi:hypothetical protein